MTEIDSEVKPSDGKTPANEAFRLFRMVIRMVTDGKIDKRRECELQERIVMTIDPKASDLEIYTALTAIETTLNCPKCKGTGQMSFVNGYDTDNGFVATDSWVERCKCCGG